MAGKIPREFIDELIARVDLVDLIDARVNLKKVGNHYSARCPFHTEKTPSFTVNREKQFYHCFGCGAHGNAIGFLMDYERQSFVEAVESLAGLLGLKIPKEWTADDKPDQRTLYEVQEKAAAFYAQALKDHPEAKRAVDYLKKRGITGEIAKQFLLGYAPPGWQNLPSSLPGEKLLEAGLAISKEQGSFYDRFRDRIMFPIRDKRGRVVGFGGRVLDDSTPKYLNSPETPVFKKHKEVYGLYELLKSLRKPSKILVVEGYMDVIALAQNGIPYAVATLGTATSTDHIELLFRYVEELIFSFDGDKAGQNAAWKALESALPALKEGLRLRFLLLPEGHDPDSLVRQEGTQAFEERLANSLTFSDYFFQKLSESLDLQSIEGRASLIQKAKPLIAKLPQNVFRDMMQARLMELAGQKKVESYRNSTKLNKQKPPRATERTRPSALRVILALLLKNPELFQTLNNEAREMLKTSAAGEIINKLFAHLEQTPGLNSGGILERFRGEAQESQVNALMSLETEISEESAIHEFSGALEQFSKQQKKQRLDELLNKDLARLSQKEREEMRELLK